jgi:hypothetical protein
MERKENAKEIAVAEADDIKAKLLKERRDWVTE